MNIISKWWFPAAVAVSGIGIIWATVSEDNIGKVIGIFLGILLIATVFYVRWYQRKK